MLNLVALAQIKQMKLLFTGYNVKRATRHSVRWHVRKVYRLFQVIRSIDYTNETLGVLKNNRNSIGGIAATDSAVGVDGPFG